MEWAESLKALRSEAVRLETFATSVSYPQDLAQDLARSGFYNLGSDMTFSRVCCFFCDKIVCRDEITDLQKEHRRDCPLVLGEITNNLPIPGPKNEPGFSWPKIDLSPAEVAEQLRMIRQEIKELEEKQLCKICTTARFETVCLPCGHLIGCLSCIQALEFCPGCRGPIEGLTDVRLW